MKSEYIIEKSGKRRLAVHKKCEQCGTNFLVRKNFETTQKFCSRRCRDIAKQERIKTSCAYCGKQFFITKSKFNHSKSGLHFCCREHKDISQRLSVNIGLTPNHYGTGSGVHSYRKWAFNEYPHKCAICGWCEDERILEVHHVDENRANNEITNLIILCPICHRYISLSIYTLSELKNKYK